MSRTTPVVVGGAYVEPRAYELMTAVFLELFVFDMADVVETLRVRLFLIPGVVRRELVAVPTDAADARVRTLGVWRLTDHGELLLRHLLDLVRQPVVDADTRRREIEEALALAGYPAEHAS